MPRDGVDIQLYSSFNLGSRWGGWSTPHPGCFTPGKVTRYPLYRRLGGPQGQSAEVRNRRRNNSIHFLGITLKNTQTHTDTAVFRTYNDRLYHPKELLSPNKPQDGSKQIFCRIHTYPLEKPEKETKLNTVRNILHNNQYNKNILNCI